MHPARHPVLTLAVGVVLLTSCRATSSQPETIKSASSSNGRGLAGPVAEELDIDPRFLRVLPENRLLADGAVQAVRLKSGGLFLISVGVVANPESERHEAEQAISLRRVALAKARAQLVEYCRVDVQSDTEVRTIATIRTIDNQERIDSEDRLDTSILQRARGLLQRANIVGTWYSAGRSTFHLALALTLEEDTP